MSCDWYGWSGESREFNNCDGHVFNCDVIDDVIGCREWWLIGMCRDVNGDCRDSRNDWYELIGDWDGQSCDWLFAV